MYVCICMYVYMYVCMYVCMYVYMYVCMYACMYELCVFSSVTENILYVQSLYLFLFVIFMQIRYYYVSYMYYI